LLTNAGISSFKRSTSRMSRGMPFRILRNDATTLMLYRSLKRELVRAQEEIKRIQSVPLVIGQFMEAIDQK
jgi:ATP-dependent 26S proteasome regulatory subunit